MKILQELEPTPSVISDRFLIILIRCVSGLLILSLFFPALLVSLSENIEWKGILGIGFGSYNGDLVFAPAIFISCCIILFNVVLIIKYSFQLPQWDHIKPMWIVMCLYIFQLLSKRQQLIIIFNEPIQVIAAQKFYVPHPGFGYFLIFFSSIVLVGLVGIRGRIAHLPSQIYITHLTKYALAGIFLFLLPFYFFYDGNRLEILLGLGYGFVWEGNTFSNAAAISGWLLCTAQILLLIFIIAFQEKKYLKIILTFILIGLAAYSYTQVGFAIWRLYIPGGHAFPIYPPISIFMVIQWWIYANVGWDMLVSL